MVENLEDHNVGDGELFADETEFENEAGILRIDRITLALWNLIYYLK